VSDAGSAPRSDAGGNPFAAGTAASIARAVREGRVRAIEVAHATLDDIDRRNPQLNAFTEVTRARALAEAAAVDAALARGESPGPLAGVPFAVKNLFDIEGVVTRAVTGGAAAGPLALGLCQVSGVGGHLGPGAVQVGAEVVPAHLQRPAQGLGQVAFSRAVGVQPGQGAGGFGERLAHGRCAVAARHPFGVAEHTHGLAQCVARGAIGQCGAVG
jgi:hypothetical protein